MGVSVEMPALKSVCNVQCTGLLALDTAKAKWGMKFSCMISILVVFN